MLNHKDWKNVPMPPGIAARPRTPEGYPVPYVNFVDSVHGPDLRVLDAKRVQICVERRMCAICGGPLGSMKVFIGGENCVTNRMFADPAMHEECARYAAAVCPYLATQNYHHAKDAAIARKKSAGVMLMTNPLCPGEGSKRPDRMALYFCKQFSFKNVKDSRGRTERVIVASPPIKVEYF